MAHTSTTQKNISRDKVGAANLPALVTLFEVTIDEGQILRFVGSDVAGISIDFAGHKYIAYPLAAKGFAWSADGPPARPTLELSNLLGGFDDAAESQALLGKPIRRILTMVNELDAPLGNGGGSCFPPEQWIIERVARLDDRVVRFELSAAASLENRSFPQRIILRDICQHTYRRWDEASGAFSYDNVTCPHRDPPAQEQALYFRLDGTNTRNQAEDACSLRLETGCKKRFTKGPLPFLGFPGVTRF